MNAHLSEVGRGQHCAASEPLARDLPHIGAHLLTRLDGLHREPAASIAEAIACELDGAARHVRQLALCLRKEEAPDA